MKTVLTLMFTALSCAAPLSAALADNAGPPVRAAIGAGLLLADLPPIPDDDGDERALWLGIPALALGAFLALRISRRSPASSAPSGDADR